MSKKKKSAAKMRSSLKVGVIPPTVENLPLLSDLNRALGLIQAVQDTTKGERRATVLQEAIDLISKHLP